MLLNISPCSLFSTAKMALLGYGLMDPKSDTSLCIALSISNQWSRKLCRMMMMDFSGLSVQSVEKEKQVFVMGICR